jgi:tetratricopeptide (TPR) repeat protein
MAGWVPEATPVRKEIRDSTGFTAVQANGQDLRALAYHRRGLAWFNAGEPDLALADLATAATLPNPSVHLDLSRAVVRNDSRRDPEAALTDVNRWIASNVANPWGYLVRGQIHERAGRYDAARDDYLRSLKVYKPERVYDTEALDFFLPAKLRLAWLCSALPAGRLGNLFDKEETNPEVLANQVVSATKGYSFAAQTTKAAALAATGRFEGKNGAVKVLEAAIDFFEPLLKQTDQGEIDFAKKVLKRYQAGKAYRLPLP